MRSIKLILFFSVLFLQGNSQEIGFQWTNPITIKGSEGGIFDHVVGQNSEFTYIVNRELRSSVRYGTVYLHAISNNGKKLSHSILLRDKKSDSHEDMKLTRIFIQEDNIFVFWEKENRENLEVYVQTFDSRLKKGQALKKIQQYPVSEGSKVKKPVFFVLSNKSLQGKLLLGAELSATKGSSVKVEARVLNKDLSFETLAQFDLPIAAKSNSSELTSFYEYGDDGNLHVTTRIQEDRKDKQKEFFDLYTFVDLSNGTSFHYPFKFENKRILGIDVTVTKEEVNFIAMYMDLSPSVRNNKKVKINGLFRSTLDKERKTLAKTQFEAFDQKFLKNLYQDDEKDLVKKKKAGQSEEIDDSYVIEEVRQHENGDITLFTTIKENYSVTTCQPRGPCITNYYCRKKNVTIFNLDKNGNIIWAQNIDRSFTYDGWNIRDVTVIEDKDNYYVVYGSTPTLTKFFPTEKAKKIKKSDVLEYAVVNKNTGKVKTKLYEKNKQGTSKKEKVSFNSSTIQLFDGQMSTYHNNTKRTTSGKIVRGFSIILFPIGLFTGFGNYNRYLISEVKLGKGYIK